ncbi:gtp-binding sey1 protein [Rutstroemia sp. NJR-2017a WRK4]|nr:gtp-binding sey1 protein [Rutstroemia sp. NJR-2017a WRK4]
MATFKSIHNRLIQIPAPLLPPASPHDAALTSEIASLQLHPTLETILHVLNLDLPSAHFLVRHMQSAPAFEGMYLHGILHRIEGDYDNARAWYSDVKESDIYAKIWGKEGHTWKDWKEKDSDNRQSLDEGQKFLDAVQRFKETKGKEGDKAALEGQSRRELDETTRWCVERFGTHKMVDASSAWVKASDEIRKMGEDQVNGDSGRRKF